MIDNAKYEELPLITQEDWKNFELAMLRSHVTQYKLIFSRLMIQHFGSSSENVLRHNSAVLEFKAAQFDFDELLKQYAAYNKKAIEELKEAVKEQK
jgi:hypothetical protein